MKPSLLAASLPHIMDAGLSAMIWGPPAVGKSSVVHQATQARGLALADPDFRMIEIRLGMFDPVDLSGVPIIQNGQTVFAPPSFLPTRGNGVIFLDELPQATPALMAKGSMLLHERRLNDWTCPPGWSVIAAGNRSTDGAASNKMPSNAGSRVIHLDFEMDHKNWTAHALDNGFALPVVAFLQFKWELLHAFDKTQRTFPSPRTWEYVSKIYKTQPAPEIAHELYAGCVGEGAAAEFIGFLEVFADLPTPQSILMDPDGAPVPAGIATICAVAASIARAANDTNFDAFARYIARMPAEYGTFAVTAAVKRTPAIANTAGFIRWGASGNNLLT